MLWNGNGRRRKVNIFCGFSLLRRKLYLFVYYCEEKEEKPNNLAKTDIYFGLWVSLELLNTSIGIFSLSVFFFLSPNVLELAIS